MKVQKLKTKTGNKKYIFVLSFLFLIFGFDSASALEGLPAKYTLIQPIPGVQEVSNFPEYVGYLIPFVLGLAALLALIQIVWGGFKRASAFGNETEIKDSEDRMSKAIWGLLLALFAYLFLYTINPDLVNMQFFPEPVIINPNGLTQAEKALLGKRFYTQSGCEKECSDKSSKLKCALTPKSLGFYECLEK